VATWTMQGSAVLTRLQLRIVHMSRVPPTQLKDNQYECSYCGNFTRHADASDSDHTGCCQPRRTHGCVRLASTAARTWLQPLRCSAGHPGVSSEHVT
jgi:hypothetical protein